MEAGTMGRGSAAVPGTLAELAFIAAARYGDRPAARHKVDGEWRSISFNDLAERTSEVARGLIALGIEPGERVSILSNTRPEWTCTSLGILASGAVSVSIYQTNSPEECEYVLSHSGARAVIVEDAEQLAKIELVRERLPNLEHVVAMELEEERPGVISLDDLRALGRAVDTSELARRSAAVEPGDACIYIYTSGTTGPPKGCIISHGNYRAMIDMVRDARDVEGDELLYLFLPLAHAFALLVQFVLVDAGGELAYWSKDVTQIIAELSEVRPTYFPSVPRIFEKIYATAHSQAPDPAALDDAVQIGLRVRSAFEAGEPVPAELEQQFQRADRELFAPVRALFGGRIRRCVTGAAPISTEILEFFYACGVPIFEGYGLTETATAATANTLEEHRFGSVGKPLPGVEVEIAEDGEVLVRGPNIFQGYYRDSEATDEALRDGWLHTGDLGYLDQDGFLYITGRKKDIIITAGGKNITPANIENSLKTSRWISQAVVVGDRRPYLVALITLDPDELPAFAEEHGLSVDEVHRSPEMHAEVARAVEQANAAVGRVEQVKRFSILPRDLSQETGELTPTLKVKRSVVHDVFAPEIEALYASDRAIGEASAAPPLT